MFGCVGVGVCGWGLVGGGVYVCTCVGGSVGG